jgi:hypothetical protein
MRCRGWVVELAASADAKAVHKGLKEEGGFGFTHAGLLRRDDGSSFSAAEADGRAAQKVGHLRA